MTHKYEIRGEAIRIPGVVVVRVAVGVDIAEVVGVVVIRRALPPIRRGATVKPTTDKTVQKYTQNMSITFLCRSLTHS